MSMKESWIRHAITLSAMPADLYSGSRKILRNIRLEFNPDMDLTLSDAGYSRNKMHQLRRNYLHEESITAASGLWDEYREKPKYRSVAISCFARLVKDHGGPRGSKMGSCLLAVTITMLNRREAEVNMHYRTTEFLKKFPADLIFLYEDILSRFNLEGMAIKRVVAHFDNITFHPAYFVTIVPHLKDPIKSLETIRQTDQLCFDWILKWTARYLIPEQGRGIQKFAQAVRVKMDAEKRITGKTRDRLIQYIDEHHPGFARSSYDDAVASVSQRKARRTPSTS